MTAFRNYLMPVFAERRLDTLTPADEDKLKKRLLDFAVSTYNNAASAMNMVLKAAARWGVISHVPHRFMLLKRQKGRSKFYDFDQYEWLVEAAAKLDPRNLVLVLLGGDAGLRRGEIIALEQDDVDLRRGQLTIERSEWKGKVTETKGKKYRVVPLTQRLQKALTANRHLRGPRVLLHGQRRDGDRQGAPAVDVEDAEARAAPIGRRAPHPSPHLLLAPRDERGARPLDPGPRGSRGSHHHARLHAPREGGDRARHQAARRPKLRQPDGNRRGI
jgi:integrase